MNHPFPGEDAQFEQMLARSEGALPDNGFSLRVLAALPAPRPSRPHVSVSNVLRVILCIVGAFVGLSLSWYYSWSSIEMSAFTGQLNQAWSFAVTASADPGWLTMGLVAVGSLLYAFFERWSSKYF
jgi:hypothetical protein